MAPRALPPGEGVTFVDRYGDHVNIAPNGDGDVLISIGTPDPNEPDRMVAVPAVDLIPLFTSAVKASGQTPEKLRSTAIRQGLVKPRVTQPVKPTRQARRAQKRAATKKNQSAFIKPEAKEL